MTAGPYTAAEDAIILANIDMSSADLRAYLPTRSAESIRRHKTTLRRERGLTVKKSKQASAERIAPPYEKTIDFSPGWGAYRAQREAAS